MEPNHEHFVENKATSGGGATEVLYQVNGRDEIVAVNDRWEQFAVANSGATLVADRVIGRSLWEFITDETTELLYRDLLSRARGGHPAHFAFRCDSPDRRRLLEMRITAEVDGRSTFSIQTISEEERPPQSLLDPNRSASDEMLRICGWCKTVDTGERWVEVEEAVEKLKLFLKPSLPSLTHGICEDCYARMVALIQEHNRSLGDAEGRKRHSATE